MIIISPRSSAWISPPPRSAFPLLTTSFWLDGWRFSLIDSIFLREYYWFLAMWEKKGSLFFAVYSWVSMDLGSVRFDFYFRSCFVCTLNFLWCAQTTALVVWLFLLFCSEYRALGFHFDCLGTFFVSLSDAVLLFESAQFLHFRLLLGLFWVFSLPLHILNVHSIFQYSEGRSYTHCTSKSNGHHFGKKYWRSSL